MMYLGHSLLSITYSFQNESRGRSILVVNFFSVLYSFQDQKERLDDPREHGRIKVDGRGRPMSNKNAKGGKCCK